MARRTVVLLVALLLAGLSGVAVWAFLDNARDEAREGLIQVPVYRATEFVPRGAIGDESLELFEESTELDGLLPVGAITTREQLEATLVGRVSLGPISANQVVTTELWADPAAEIEGLAELIEPGFQAMSIRLDDVRGVSGFVQPGDRINVLASDEIDIGPIVDALRVPAGRAIFFPGLQAQLGLTDEEMVELADALPVRIEYTQFVLQDLLVLAVGSDTSPVVPDAETETGPVVGEAITVALTAEQAERLAFSFEYMSPWLTLVPPDFVAEDTPGAVVDDLVDLPGQIVEQLRGFGFFGIPNS